MSLADEYTRAKAKAKFSKQLRRKRAREKGEKEALEELRGKRS